MYFLQLTESLIRAQEDDILREVTVGDLLRQRLRQIGRPLVGAAGFQIVEMGLGQHPCHFPAMASLERA